MILASEIADSDDEDNDGDDDEDENVGDHGVVADHLLQDVGSPALSSRRPIRSWISNLIQ